MINDYNMIIVLSIIFVYPVPL